LAKKIGQVVAPLLSAPEPTLVTETARLLAMVQDDSAEAGAKVLSFVTGASSATMDFHYLVVLSRFKGPLPTNFAVRVANGLLSMERKLAGQENRTKQNWTTRLAELTQKLVQRDAKLADAIIVHPDFPSPAHLPLVSSLGQDRSQAAARRFFAAAQSNPRFAWSAPLVELLSALPREQVRPLLRKQWPNLALRDEILLKLANGPELVDREKFIAGLNSTRTEVALACVGALKALPPTEGTTLLVPAMRLLRKSLNEPANSELRSQLLALLKYELRQDFAVKEPPVTDVPVLKASYKPILDWFAQRFPILLRQLDYESNEDPTRWSMMLKSVPWNRGDAARGAELFRNRGCESCHASSTPLGPDLGGAAERLSPTDLFDSIIFPSREVAPPYRVEVFQMRDGSSYAGIVAFESADGVIVRTGAASTVRLADSDILSRTPSNMSLMPSGLLEGLKAQDLADLYGYLKNLRRR
jgi:putative heme-binding domain-containing protein